MFFSFREAYEALRKIYRTKLELDRFLIMQLYEYEPILEVHRAAEETGHSRSGERLRAVLKRASCVLDSSYEETETIDWHCNQQEQEEENNSNIGCSRRPLNGIETMIE